MRHVVCAPHPRRSEELRAVSAAMFDFEEVNFYVLSL